MLKTVQSNLILNFIIFHDTVNCHGMLFDKFGHSATHTPGFQYMACVTCMVPFLSRESRQTFPKSTAKLSKVRISEFVALW